MAPKTIRVWLLLFSCLASLAHARDDWLPRQVAEGLAQQAAERLRQSDPKRAPAASTLLLKSRELVSKFEAKIDTWGTNGVLERAPRLTRMGLPSANQKYLDAMARFQACNLVMMVHFERGEQARQKQVGAMGLTAITMLMIALREPYLQQGGKEARIEQFLTSEAMERASARMQKDPALLEATQKECDPVVGGMFDAL